MNSIFPLDIAEQDEPIGLANRYLPGALLVSVLLHTIVALLFYCFIPEGHSPKARIEKSISLTLVAPILPSIEKTQSPPDEVITKNLEAEPLASEIYSQPQPQPQPQQRKPKEAPLLPEEQSARTLITTRIEEKKFIVDRPVFISECTLQQRHSKIHRCSEDNKEKWQVENTNTYQGVFAKNFQNLNQGSDFQQDMENIIRLISVQESIYAAVASTGSESEMQKKEQLRISLEIDRLLDKNQALMQLIGVR